ncbi:hypothetical protein THIOSC15_1870003 [uncultured Thiomicrorhabdus sp.]
MARPEELVDDSDGLSDADGAIQSNGPLDVKSPGGRCDLELIYESSESAPSESVELVPLIESSGPVGTVSRVVPRKEDNPRSSAWASASAIGHALVRP